MLAKRLIGYRRVRSCKGYKMAELGPALFLAFVVLLFPMMTLATLGMRYTFLLIAAKEAARVAAKCSTFTTNTSSSNLSAKNLAPQIVNMYVAKFPGISVSQTDVLLMIYNIPNNTTTIQTTSPTSIDTINNVYDIQVRVTATVRPLIMNGSFFGSIPGLTAPFSVRTTAAATVENTNGLLN